MARISTHVLDMAHGRPASGVRAELWFIENGQRLSVATTVTNSDGRTAEPYCPAILSIPASMKSYFMSPITSAATA